MAFIRISRCPADDGRQKDEVIINTRHVLTVSADTHQPSRGSWVHLVAGDPILTCLSFEEIWTLIQRET